MSPGPLNITVCASKNMTREGKHRISYRKRSKEIFLINQRLFVTFRSSQPLVLHLFCQRSGSRRCRSCLLDNLSLSSTSPAPCQPPCPAATGNWNPGADFIPKEICLYCFIPVFHFLCSYHLLSFYSHLFWYWIHFLQSIQVSLPQTCLMPSVGSVPGSSQAIPGVYKWTQIFQGRLCYL